MITHEKATDKNIITKQVVINTPTSARLLPITADAKVIDEIQQALNELERLKKIEKLLELYRELRTVKDDMFDCCEIVYDEYYDIRKTETDLERQIKELENEQRWLHIRKMKEWLNGET